MWSKCRTCQCAWNFRGVCACWIFAMVSLWKILYNISSFWTFPFKMSSKHKARAMLAMQWNVSMLNLVACDLWRTLCFRWVYLWCWFFEGCCHLSKKKFFTVNEHSVKVFSWLPEFKLLNLRSFYLLTSWNLYQIRFKVCGQVLDITL